MQIWLKKINQDAELSTLYFLAPAASFFFKDTDHLHISNPMIRVIKPPMK